MHSIDQRTLMPVRLLPAFLILLFLASLMHQTASAQPMLTVNRDTGAAAITNAGSTGFPMDAYSVQSAAGNLSLANWMSLEDNPGVAGTGWFEGNPTSNRLSELRSGGTSTLAPSASWPIGNVFQPPAPTQFGQSFEDLVFLYSDPMGQPTVPGMVNYTGTNVNNLVLFADPATGNVKIRNTSPFNVDIDGYTVISPGGSLNVAMWTSLQDQPGVAPNWFEGGASNDFRISEVMSQGTTTLMGNNGTTFDLGNLFRPAGTRDLVFQFLLAGNAQPNTGVVLYQAAPNGGGLPGDYNNNGRVDAADYVLWRKNPAAFGGNPGGYNTWRMNFDRTSGSGSASALTSGAVPEPSALLLVAGGLLALAGTRRF